MNLLTTDYGLLVYWSIGLINTLVSNMVHATSPPILINSIGLFVITLYQCTSCASPPYIYFCVVNRFTFIHMNKVVCFVLEFPRSFLFTKYLRYLVGSGMKQARRHYLHIYKCSENISNFLVPYWR